MKPPSARPPTIATAPPLRIFLLEDSCLLRELLTEAFASIGGVVLAGFAEAEDDAFEQLCRLSYQILILDIELKKGNGINLLRRLCVLPGHLPETTIIFSNNVSAAYRRAAAPLGVDYFFDKTAEFTQLQQLLEALGNKNAPV